MQVVSGPNGCKVLVVEDHADSALILVRLLRRLGYSAEAAATVAEARAKAAAAWPDGDGLELVRGLKAIRPVRLRGTAEAGFDAHPTKPATMDQLHEALRRACEESAN